MHKALASSSNIINLIFKFEKILKKILAFPVPTAFTNVTTLLSVRVPVQQNNDWTPSTKYFAFWSSHPTPLSLSR